eukprot:95143-Pyramimonas_sp.AAC.1
MSNAHGPRPGRAALRDSGHPRLGAQENAGGDDGEGQDPPGPRRNEDARVQKRSKEGRQLQTASSLGWTRG